MPYKVKGKCVYKKDTGKKVGCTKGDIKDYLAALHANVIDESTNKLQFTKPKFEFEWMEAIRYPEFEEMGKDGWVEIAKNGHTEIYSDIKDVLGNVELDFNSLEEPKKERFHKAFNNRKIETPIAVKFSDSDYDLVAGNTRLSGLVNNGITNFPIWIVDISHLMETMINEDKIKGGKADKITKEDIAKKFGVTVDNINKELEMGVEVELEHTKSRRLAKEIAMDHLTEIPDYYTRLKKMEKQGESKWKKREKKLDESLRDYICDLIRINLNN